MEMTQKQFGERVGIAEPTIRRYELGKLNPKIETLQKIADGISISVDFFTGHPPFNDLDFLDHYKSVIIHSMVKKGILERPICLSNIDEYHYWKYISDNILNIENEGNVLHIQYKPQRDSIPSDTNTEKVRMTAVHFTLDFTEVLEKIHDKKHAVVAYSILNSLNFLNWKGLQIAADRVQELTEIPDYQKSPGEEE